MKLLFSAFLFLLPLTSAFAANKIVGVGVSLDNQGHNFQIRELVPGAPAALDGTIKAGDELVAVKPFPGTHPGWISVDQLSLEELVQLVRGDEGTDVSLQLANAQGQYIVKLSRKAFEVN